MKTFKGEKASPDYDAVVVLALKASQTELGTGCCSKYIKYIEETRQFDENFDKEGGFILLPEGNEIRRLIFSPVGPVNRDVDDVRRFRDAALRGVKRAMKAGALKPLVVVPTNGLTVSQYALYDVVTVLGAYEAIYSVRKCFITLKS